GTTYYYTLVPYNAVGPAENCVEEMFATNANGCYCTSAPTSVDGTGIINVQIVATDFPNTVAASPVYNDHTATVVDMSQGINNNVQITFDVTSFGSNSYDYNTVIWIDFNDDYNFDATEIVYVGLSPTTASPTLLDASFVMPATAPLGEHRMRIVATDALQNPSNPCYSGTYGETADFTVNIIEASCAPVAIASSTIVPDCANDEFNVEFDVTDLGDGTPTISDGTTSWPITATGVVSVGPFMSGSSVTLTALHGSDTTCDITLGTFTYTCPPVNNDCAAATALTPGGVFADNEVVGTLAGATNSAAPAPGCGSYSGPDVWYSVEVPASGSITIETNSNSSTLTDSGMAVYSGTCGALTLIECDDDDSLDGAFSLVSLTALTPGEILYVVVWEYGGDIQDTFKISAYDASLSANSFTSTGFVAYPNPVKDILNLEYDSEIANVQVINLLGQTVIDRAVNATTTQINMSQLNAGTYLVNVTSNNGIQKTIKVVKQ
ncbi:GEVED domain-containing protein, partial [Flavobacterium sp.]|uniref:GEVED domain-containing protein n=1 Tax=Flavobacterium sp. TaxID=239 RepID=UPI0035284607